MSSELVGRGRELAELERLIDRSPLTCVIGPPGVGKTRLALAHVARAPRGRVRWFCDLREALELADVWHLLGECIGSPIAAAADHQARIERLAARLAERQGLLVLDNFEQLAPLAPRLLAPLIERRPEVRLVVTSRVRLGIDGERCLELAPLDVERDAVLLFIKRAREVRPELSFSEARLAAVGALVRELDGLPLAIELAAARLRVMEVEQLVEREGGQHRITADQALRRSIDASWQLLEPDERSALARCAYFCGGFTLEAAEAVVAGDVASLLGRLLDCALLQVGSTDGGPPERRFSMLAAIREHAADRLDELGELGETRRRHRAYFLERGRRWSREVEGPRADDALAHLERERQNLLRVHADAAAPPADPLSAARAALCLETLLLRTGPCEQRLDLLDRAIAVAGVDRDPDLGTRMLVARANVRNLIGRPEAALEDHERALELARASGEPSTIGYALRSFGGTLYRLGRLERAEVLLREAIADYDGGQDPATLNNLGICLANRGETGEAQEVFRRTIGQARRAGNRRYQAIALGNLATSEEESGDRIAARAHYEEALALQREKGDRVFETHLTGQLAILDLGEQKLDDAARRLAAAGELARATGNRLFEGMAELHDAVRLELLGETDASFRKYEAALAVLEGAAPAQIDAVALAALAALQASGGAVAAGRERWRRAAIRAEGGHPQYGRAVEIGRAHVELAARLAESPRSTDAATRERAIDEALAWARGFVAERPGLYARSALARLERFAQTARARLDAESAAARGPTLTVAADGAWFRIGDGEPVSLRRRRALRRVLAALAGGAEQGRALSLEDLFARGWPGDRAGGQAAVNRVHNALATLRKMGLRDALVRDDGGYRLTGAAVVEI